MRRYVTPHIKLKLKVTGNRIAQLTVDENSFIDWGDGTPVERFSRSLAHVYSAEGTYDVMVVGISKIFVCVVNNNTNFKVSEIDLTRCKQLKELNIGNFAGTSIDVSNLVNLKKITVRNSSSLQSVVGLENLTKCEEIDFSNSIQISQVNVSTMPLLRILYLYNTSISNLDLSNNLKQTYLLTERCNFLKNLELVNLPNLVSVNAGDGLESIQIINCPQLSNLSVRNSKIQTISVTNLPKLQNLTLNESSLLSSIVINNVPNLKSIVITNHLITSIDLSDVPKLNYLYMKNVYNQQVRLSNLILPSTRKLEYVNLDNSNVDIDLSNQLKLLTFYYRREMGFAYFNNFIDISNCPLLKDLRLVNIHKNKPLDLSINTGLTFTDLRHNIIQDLILNTSEPLKLNVRESLNTMNHDLYYNKNTYKSLIIKNFQRNIYLPPISYLVNTITRYVDVPYYEIYLPEREGRFVLNAVGCPNLLFDDGNGGYSAKTTKEILVYLANQVVANNLYEYTQYFVGTTLSANDTKDLYDGALKTLLFDSRLRGMHGYDEDSTYIHFNFTPALEKSNSQRTITLKNDADVFLVIKNNSYYLIDRGDRIRINNGVITLKGGATCTGIDNGNGTSTYTFSVKNTSNVEYAVQVYENKYNADYTTKIIS